MRSRLIKPGDESRRARSEAVSGAWMQRVVDLDGAAGRKMSDFCVPMDALRQTAEHLELNGVRVVAGAGNVFHVRHVGSDPVVVQSRPLASRVVRLKTI